MIRDIKQRYKQLNNIIADMNARLATAPDGCLYSCVNKKRNSIQYYSVKKGNSRERDYLNSATQLSTIKALSTKKYCQQVLATAISERDAIAKLLHYYEDKKGTLCDELYNQLNSNDKNITDSLLLPDTEYITWWQSQSYPQKEFDETNDTEFITDRGERVRSKSELLIANTLNKLEIPYRYECELVLWDGTIIYPDFTLLDIRTREEKYYEHAGRMTDFGYGKDFMWRVRKYENNGIFVGDKLFFSFESREYPLSTKNIADSLCRLWKT